MPTDPPPALNPHQQMDQAVRNYLELSVVLRDDLMQILNSESNSAPWRRNFIRITSSSIEGLIYAIREMSAVSKLCDSPKLGDEKIAIDLNNRRSTIENFKDGLIAAHKLFEISPRPDFGTRNWEYARSFFDRRDGLMHPKSPKSLDVSEADWETLHTGAVWMLEQIFGFIEKLQNKFIHAPRLIALDELARLGQEFDAS